ncbi:hypothetical protein NY547_11205 [Cnuibacter physcomitrellae]|uniref:hypothetical protein n=1 Tax=Cnuibacter physcomitrellae TaxID=1619308 RepID=UPI002175E7A2|nr:hypothetical protein [Cnuibacter physcomitrellae]MCS5497804.1 hypothetical protein [Cnuibacter physcomitrellae]
MNATTSNAFRTAGPIAAMVLAAGTLSSCVGPTGDAEVQTAASTPPATPDPTAVAEQLAADEEAQLPIPAADIPGWASEAVPADGSPGHQGTSSGWMSEHSAQRLVSTNGTLEAGSYQMQLACRGEGTITATVTTIDGATAGDSATCSNATVAFDATIPEAGLVTTLEHDGDPTIYALSVTRVG